MTRILFLMAPVIWGGLVLGLGYLATLERKWALKQDGLEMNQVVVNSELNDRTQGFIS